MTTQVHLLDSFLPNLGVFFSGIGLLCFKKNLLLRSVKGKERLEGFSCYFVFCLFVMLGTELRALHMVGKHSLPLSDTLSFLYSTLNCSGACV